MEHTLAPLFAPQRRASATGLAPCKIIMAFTNGNTKTWSPQFTSTFKRFFTNLVTNLQRLYKLFLLLICELGGPWDLRRRVSCFSFIDIRSDSTDLSRFPGRVQHNGFCLPCLAGVSPQNIEIPATNESQINIKCQGRQQSFLPASCSYSSLWRGEASHSPHPGAHETPRNCHW